MKGDTSKIEPLALPSSDNDAAAVSGKDAQDEKESREMDGASPKNEIILLGNNESHDAGYQSSSGTRQMMMHSEEETQHVNIDEVSIPSHDSPEAMRTTDSIFREPHHDSPTSWSKVVSSNVMSTPTRMTTRSSSGETLLTSNMSQLPPHRNSIQYQGAARARSRSCDLDSPPQYLNESSSLDLGSSADSSNHQQDIGFGIPPSHPGQSSYRDSTLPTRINEGTVQHSPMMYPSTPYQEFKPRPSSMGSYSPISLGDSMTDQTSPMSSPSLSPHVSPAMTSRKQHGDGPPPMAWQLSDAAEFHHPDPSTMHHHRLHSNPLPQSIPEHHRHEPVIPGQHHSYMMPPQHGNMKSGPTSPPRHFHSQPGPPGHHHHHQSMVYHRRPGFKSHPTGPTASQAPGHHRSSTEILKTLLRKKACLYEPETSFAVSLVTWLVGRHLALSQGYFTRQQLQAGVHSCVAGKIAEGHVTRTKVNRCMQVILNSCFHYIIPRPDGGEECGMAFRDAFAREAADEEHLLGTLSPPWNDLSLRAVVAAEGSLPSWVHESEDDDGERRPSQGKAPGKESSSASQAGDSLDSGGKRSVLLCFNENIRSAADVFRCHNEFIRDVAHTGNLILSREDWQTFFSGTKAYRKRSASFDSYEYRHSYLAEMHDRVDQQGLSKLRTTWCAKRYDHDHAFCAFAHVDVNRGWLRRNPFTHSYKPTMCPYIKPLPDAQDCYVNMCPHGVKCSHSHSKEEILYHPEIYKRQPCRSAPGSCPVGDICPYAHAEVSHGYNRQAKRHYNDHSPLYRATHPGSKRRVLNQHPRDSTGFGKLPDGSPMLYIDPAPLSEFEKTLFLPGLQAIFRDHSSSIFYSSMNESSPCEYGPFGFRNTQQIVATNTPNETTGKFASD